MASSEWRMERSRPCIPHSLLTLTTHHSLFAIRYSLFARSASGEHRLAFLHEGGATFDVILALEALLHHLGRPRQVALAFVLHHLADDVLDGIDGERRVGRNRIGIIADVVLELGVRHHAVDETHGARLLGVELPRREEDLLGEGRPDEVRQPLDPGKPIAEAELRGRNSEARIVGADAQIAAHRQPDTAADAVAAYHGYGRLGEFVE